jgi:hypothetical protein
MKLTVSNKHTKGIMKKTVVAIALAAALPALTTLAQPGPGRGLREGGGGPDGHRPPPPPIIKALDANGDGVIDAQEIANAPAALAALDTNGDSQLTPDELHPRSPQGQGQQGANGDSRRGPGGQGQTGAGEGPDGHRHPAPPLITALDLNGDGTIDAQELAKASASLLTLDKNGDGQLSAEEFCPPPPGGGGSEQ